MGQYDEHLGESLSALMDGEASDLDTRRVLKALASEDSHNAMQMRDKWRRYHSVSAVMKGDVASTIDYSEAIAHAIGNEVVFKTSPLAKILNSSGRFENHLITNCMSKFFGSFCHCSISGFGRSSGCSTVQSIGQPDRRSCWVRLYR